MPSQRLEDFVGLGTSGDRPVSLDLPSTCAGFRYETDTGAWVWDGSIWVQITSVSGTGFAGPGSAVDEAVVIWDGTSGNLVKDSAKLLPTGDIIGDDDTQVLTNKTIDGADNTITGIEGTVTDGSATEDQLIWDGADWVAQRSRYIIGCAVGGLLTADQDILYHRFTKDVAFPSDFGDYLGHSSQAGGAVEADADVDIDVSQAANATPTTFSSVGTITIGLGTVDPTFTSSGVPIIFAKGDVIRVRAPSSPDATFESFFATLVGFEV